MLACQRRAGALEEDIYWPEPEYDVIRFRCAGQVKAFMLLELLNRGAETVTIDVCPPQLCRFGSGAEQVQVEMAKAHRVYTLLGGDPDKLRYGGGARMPGFSG